jgi:hypothetical protein
MGQQETFLFEELQMRYKFCLKGYFILMLFRELEDV